MPKSKDDSIYFRASWSCDRTTTQGILFQHLDQIGSGKKELVVEAATAYLLPDLLYQNCEHLNQSQSRLVYRAICQLEHRLAYFKSLYQGEFNFGKGDSVLPVSSPNHPGVQSFADEEDEDDDEPDPYQNDAL